MNKGNCLFANGDYEKAREYYQEAYNVEASCTEALFNLGIPAACIYYKLIFSLLSCRLGILLLFKELLCQVWLHDDRYMSVCPK